MKFELGSRCVGHGFRALIHSDRSLDAQDDFETPLLAIEFSDGARLPPEVSREEVARRVVARELGGSRADASREACIVVAKERESSSTEPFALPGSCGLSPRH